MDPRRAFEAIVFVLRTGCQGSRCSRNGLVAPVQFTNIFGTGKTGFFKSSGRQGLLSMTNWKELPGNDKTSTVQ